MHLFDPRLPKLVQFSEDPILDFEPRIVMWIYRRDGNCKNMTFTFYWICPLDLSSFRELSRGSGIPAICQCSQCMLGRQKELQCLALLRSYHMVWYWYGTGMVNWSSSPRSWKLDLPWHTLPAWYSRMTEKACGRDSWQRLRDSRIIVQWSIFPWRAWSISKL